MSEETASRILIVGDDASSGMFFKTQLQTFGYQMQKRRLRDEREQELAKDIFSKCVECSESFFVPYPTY